MESLRSLISRLGGLLYNKQTKTELKRVDYDTPPVPIKVFATYDVSQLEAKMDGYRKRIRELDLELQKMNWQIDLEE